MWLKILGQSYLWKEVLSHRKLLEIEISSFNNHIMDLLSPTLHPDIEIEKKRTHQETLMIIKLLYQKNIILISKV
jgi:hypothetical protein